MNISFPAMALEMIAGANAALSLVPCLSVQQATTPFFRTVWASPGLAQETTQSLIFNQPLCPCDRTGSQVFLILFLELSSHLFPPSHSPGKCDKVCSMLKLFLPFLKIALVVLRFPTRGGLQILGDGLHSCIPIEEHVPLPFCHVIWGLNVNFLFLSSGNAVAFLISDISELQILVSATLSSALKNTAVPAITNSTPTIPSLFFAENTFVS
mmetsp:Transcript_9642/g.15100  ORF Transcript_9642/g.15100 Transcript_9642/m.15100 type:complete len:211 (-) Transcript_9642:35-667(-)